VLALILLVVSIGIADSVNPSTIAPALWLVTTPRGGRLGSYALGVFAVYLAGGLVLVFGPGPALISVLHDIRGPVEHGVELAGGVLALGFACVLVRSRPSEPHSVHHKRRSYSRSSAFMLGAGIMLIELPTAFIYFGAITAILAAHPGAPVEASLVVAYNLMFVAPILAILIVHDFAGKRFDEWVLSSEARLRHAGHVALTAAAAVGGTGRAAQPWRRRSNSASGG
jgi:cytochrome c biogenesis protein CcdA